jgi:pimeloyl-ACP methyl ester carboxylesterase
MSDTNHTTPQAEPSSSNERPEASRRTFIGGAATATALSVASGWLQPGRAAGQTPQAGTPPLAPHLPKGFSDVFSSRYVDTGRLRLHAVTGGTGRPLLLIHGWPETWYTWRLLMPALAKDFQVIAVDQRGRGQSDKPSTGYDTGSLAADMVSLMDTLGHDRFAVVGHDVGMPIGYALAADHRDRVERLVVAEAPIPGVTPSYPLFLSAAYNNALWHLTFNRLTSLNEELVRGREDIFFGFEFATPAATPLPDYAVQYYINQLRQPDALSGSFGFYRAWEETTRQNGDRMAQKLTIPVLAVGGEWGANAGPWDTMTRAATNVTKLVIPGCGHWVAEEAPAQMLAAVSTFLAPYRDGA